MTTRTDKAILGVWALLIAATIVSVALSGRGASGAGTVAILSLALIKADVVGMWFMELRAAPKPLRYAFAGWCGLTWAALVALYLGVV